jgi:hypothetical protein
MFAEDKKCIHLLCQQSYSCRWARRWTRFYLSPQAAAHRAAPESVVLRSFCEWMCFSGSLSFAETSKQHDVSAKLSEPGTVSFLLWDSILIWIHGHHQPFGLTAEQLRSEPVVPFPALWREARYLGRLRFVNPLLQQFRRLNLKAA